MERLPSPYASFDEHCKMARIMAMPWQLAEPIQRFCTEPHSPGCLLITGLPVDKILPATPANGDCSADKRSFISEGCLTAIAQLVGKPFAYESEKRGEWIHNICPVRHQEKVQTNESSTVHLELHVENAYFDRRPDFLALYCLRQDHEGKALTSVADVRAALVRMDPSDVAELQKPLFTVPSPESHHQAMGGEKWSKPRPVLNTREDPNLLCHFPGMKAANRRAQNALDSFSRSLHHHDTVYHIALQPGCLVLINNRKVAHGRGSFDPQYDGFDRWLQRIYLRDAFTSHAM